MSENKKVAVVYRSKSGYTKKYATWLAEELRCDLFEGSKVKVADLMDYDTVIYGGGLYAVGINGVKLITGNYERLKDKKLIVFAVGSSPVRQKNIDQIRNHNIPKEQQNTISFFYLRGGFDFNRLTPFNKFLMNLLKIKLKRIKNPDEDIKGLLACYTRPEDHTDKKNIIPILDSVRVAS